MRCKSRLIFVLLATCLNLGCKTSGGSDPRGQQKQPIPPSGYQPAKAERIDLIGENCCARFNETGDRIVFLGRKRTRHEHYQVYSFDFKSKKERRISFHDGDDQGPTYDRNGSSIFYSSVTDIEKENPRFLQQALGNENKGSSPIGPRPSWDGQPFELYRAEKDGTGVIRLTSNDYFDGEIDISPIGKGYVFTSFRGGRSQLLRAFDETGSNNGLTILKGDGHFAEPRFSPDGKDLIFIRHQADGSASQVWTANQNGNRPKALTAGKGLRFSPSWSPDGKNILFSSNQADDGDFEIYVMSREGRCESRLTYQLGNDTLPEFSPDGKSILFSSDRTGSLQLYVMPFSPPDCSTP